MATAQLVSIKVEVISDDEDEQSELANIYDEVVSEHEEEKSELGNINDEVVSEHEEEQSELANINDHIVSEYEEEQSDLATVNDELVSNHEEEQSELANINDEVTSEHEEEHSELVSIKEEVLSDHEEEQSELANINDEVVSENEEEQSELAYINDEVVSEHEEEQSELANVNDEVASEHEEEQSELVSIKQEVLSDHEEEQSELANINDEVVSEHEEEQSELANINDEVVSEHEEEQSELGSINDEVVSEHEEEQSELINIKEEVVSEQEKIQSTVKSSDALTTTAVATFTICTSKTTNDRNFQQCNSSISDGRLKNSQTDTQASKTSTPALKSPPVLDAKPILSREEYLTAWKNEKDVQLRKFRKLAYEVVALKTVLLNAEAKLESAVNSVPMRLEFNTKCVVRFKNNSFLCSVFIDKISVSLGRGLKFEEAKTNACELALQKIFMPHIRIVKIDPGRSELKGSRNSFLSPLPGPSQAPKTKSAAKLPSSAAVKSGCLKQHRNKQASKTSTPVFKSPPVQKAKPILSREEYLTAWKNEKDVQLQKFKKLAYKVISLKTVLPNAEAKLESAVNSVPMRLEFKTECVVHVKNKLFLCSVLVDKISVSTGRGLKFKEAKTNACKFALKRILMPHIQIVKIDPGRSELKGSRNPFISPLPESSQAPVLKSAAKLPASAAMKSGCLKRRLAEQKPLQNFVVVELLAPGCTPANTLDRSADFNDMLLEYESYFVGDGVRCAVKIEDYVLADVKGSTLESAKKLAASKALQKLKDICWVIKIKDPDIENVKNDMLDELSDQSVKVKCEDNDGNKLFQKINWYGGGVRKHGLEIVETVSPKNVLTRDSLGLTARNKITNEYEKKVRQILENYAASGNQEDLVFSCTFAYRERQVILHECRRLNLIAGCLCLDKQKYLCVGRKWTAGELVDHIMANGGETARYILVPPGFDKDTKSLLASNMSTSSTSVKNDSGHGEEDVKGSKKNAGNRFLPADCLPRNKLIPPQSMAISDLKATVSVQVPKHLKGNPVKPLTGNGFSCHRPRRFNTPAPNILGNTPLSPQGMTNSCHGPTAFRQLAHPLQRNSMRPGNRFGCPKPGGFNEKNRFHNGGMGAPGVRNDQNLYNQWGVQNNRRYFKNYGNNHNGFQSKHAVGFGGLGNDWDMGNQGGDWHNNKGFKGKYDCNRDFQNEGMRMVEFPGGRDDHRNQWEDWHGSEGYQGEFDRNSDFQNEGMRLVEFHGGGDDQRNQWHNNEGFQCEYDYDSDFQNEGMRLVEFHGGGDDQRNQWEDWHNNEGFQCEYDYDSNFQNEGMRMIEFSGGGDDQGNDWEDWHSNERFQGEYDYDSDFENEDMHLVEFPSGGDDQRNQWEDWHNSEDFQGEYDCGSDFQNEGMCMVEYSRGVSDQRNQWAGVNDRNQWDCNRTSRSNPVSW